MVKVDYLLGSQPARRQLQNGQLSFAGTLPCSLELAFAELEKARQYEPDNPEWPHARGILHGTIGDDALAIEDFNAAIRLDRTNVAAYLRRASALRRIGNFGDAIRDLETCVCLAPDDPEAFNRLAWYYATGPIATRDLDRAYELSHRTASNT